MYATPQLKEQESLRRLLLDLEAQRAQEKPEGQTQNQQQFTLLKKPLSMRNQSDNFVDSQNSDGETPLLQAIALSHLDIARLLLSSGAEVCLALVKKLIVLGEQEG